jgi:hypothetical protein
VTNSTNDQMINEIVVYIDYNIFVDAVTNQSLVEHFKTLRGSGKFIFPFTRMHIAEVNRIDQSKTGEIQSHLETIKNISNSRYMDYRDETSVFTIRDRDPFEVYQTINEIPRSYIDEVSKQAFQPLKSVIPNMPDDGFRAGDLFEFFTKSFRSSFPGLSEKINNMSREEALRYLKSKVFIGPSLEEVYEKCREILAEKSLGHINFDSFANTILAVCGFHTPNKELKKADGILSDEQHIVFASICPIVLSNDEHLRKKLSARYSKDEKLIVNLKDGLPRLFSIAGFC